MDIRMEDLGKMMLKDAEVIDNKIILDILNEYFNDTKNRMYLLYARGLNYFTVMQNHSMLATDSAKKFMEFANESCFYVINHTENGKDEVEVHEMNEIIEIEYNKETKALELWIGKGRPQYFQLMAWDDSSVLI